MRDLTGKDKRTGSVKFGEKNVASGIRLPRLAANTRLSRLAAGTLLAAALSIGAAGSAFAAGAWQQGGQGQWWYQNEDGTYPVSQWQDIDGVRYHFDKSGYVETGWRTIEGRNYYFAPSGAMQTGWLSGDGENVWYYLDEDGSMVTGWKQIGQDWYCFSNKGVMYSGSWKTINGVSYYFRKDGRMAANTYVGRRYVGEDGAKISAHDIVRTGKGSVETQVLEDAGNSLCNLPQSLQKKLFSDGWNFQYSADKDSYGTVKDENDLVYYRYFMMNESKKILYFCREDALLPAIGEYVHSHYGRPAKTEAFMNAVGMEWESLVELMDQEPVQDKSESLIFDEVFALYYGDETWETMRDTCPETYRFMEEFMAQFE